MFCFIPPSPKDEEKAAEGGLFASTQNAGTYSKWATNSKMRVHTQNGSQTPKCGHILKMGHKLSF